MKTKHSRLRNGHSQVETSHKSVTSSLNWTFLTNHAQVLVVLHANPKMVLREVALEVGITERAVQRIVQELEHGGFIERERVGRKNRYRIHLCERLHHPIETHCKIGDLLELVTNG